MNVLIPDNFPSDHPTRLQLRFAAMATRRQLVEQFNRGGLSTAQQCDLLAQIAECDMTAVSVSLAIAKETAATFGTAAMRGS